MTDGNFILVNSAFVPSSQYRLSIKESEEFLFSERIRAIRSSFPFFRESLEMIKLKLLIFNLSFQKLTENDGAGLKRQMEKTLTKNKHFLGSVITVRFWISGQTPQFSIQSEKLENAGYELNVNGLYVSVFQNIRKSISSLSNLQEGSELCWKIAASHLKSTTFDQFLLLNSENHIIEATGSNIYLVKKGTIHGASIDQGAYADIAKPLLQEIFKRLKLPYTENDGITEKELLEADEVFLANAIDGIQWVVGFEGKRYFNHTVRKINDLFISRLTN